MTVSDDASAGKAVYRGMDRATLDAAYANTRVIGMEAVRSLGAERTERSRRLLNAVAASVDLRYGPASAHRITVIPAISRRSRTLVAFIHGGYWQSSNKETYDYLAAALLPHGVSFANIEYTLAPHARMAEIVADVRRAVRWLLSNAEELRDGSGALYLVGHSAGGHLAACMLDEPGIGGVVTISGIFDLEPIQLGAINDRIGMDAREARAHSPIHHVPKSGPRLIVAVGGDELPELRRQSEAYSDACVRAGLVATFLSLPGHNHFSILDELENPHGKLTQELIALTHR